jgi:hypothetical protein
MLRDFSKYLPFWHGICNIYDVTRTKTQRGDIMLKKKITAKTKRWILTAFLSECRDWEQQRFYDTILKVSKGISATVAMHRDILYIREQAQKGIDTTNMVSNYLQGKKVFNM